MQRFTISLDADLGAAFDQLCTARGYATRSEAVRDLIRRALGVQSIDEGAAAWCAATVSYVYDRGDATVAARVLAQHHAHHDLVVSSHHTPLDHWHGLETVTLRGEVAAVKACAERLTATRGVRHGHVSIVPLQKITPVHSHEDAHGVTHQHAHLSPVH